MNRRIRKMKLTKQQSMHNVRYAGYSNAKNRLKKGQSMHKINFLASSSKPEKRMSVCIKLHSKESKTRESQDNQFFNYNESPGITTVEKRTTKMDIYKSKSNQTSGQSMQIVENQPNNYSSSDEEQKNTDTIRNIKDLEKRVYSVEDFKEVEKSDESDAIYNSKEVSDPNKQYFEDIKEKIDEELDFEITENEVVIIVAIKLPFVVKKDQDGNIELVKTNSLLYSKIYDRDEGKAKHEEWWFGWTGYFYKSEEEKQHLEKLFRKNKCIPIWFEGSVLDEYFNFYERIVLPLFHNFKTHLEHKESYDQFDNWECYLNVNQIFVDHVVDFIKKEVKPKNKTAIVWINNQHLIMMPKCLRAEIPDIS